MSQETADRIDSGQRRAYPQFARQRLAYWQRSSRWWYSVHYIVGLAATALTVTVAAKPSAGWLDLTVIAWIAAVAQGINTFLLAGPKGRGYRMAWRELALACEEFAADSTIPEKHIHDAIRGGWKIIGG